MPTTLPRPLGPRQKRRANTITAVAIALTILLAIVWLRSSGDTAPAVPAGLPPKVPAAAEAAPSQEPAGSAELGQGEGGGAAERGRAGGAERAGDTQTRPPRAKARGRERHESRGQRRNADGSRPDPPARAPRLGASGGGAGAPAAAPAREAPEFAIG
jgi:hypothetical protein